MGCSSSKATAGGDDAVVVSVNTKRKTEGEGGTDEKQSSQNEVRPIDETELGRGKEDKEEEEERGATKSQKIKLARQESKKLKLEERKQAKEEKEQQRKEKKRAASMKKEKRRRKSTDATKEKDNATARGQGRDDCDSDNEDGEDNANALPVGRSEVIVVKHSDSLRMSSGGTGDTELPELAGYDASWDALQKPPRESATSGARSTSAGTMTFDDVDDADTDFRVSSGADVRSGSQQPVGGAVSTTHSTTTASHRGGDGAADSAAVRARQIADRDFDDDFDSNVGHGMYGSHAYTSTGAFPGGPVTLSPQKAGVVKAAAAGGEKGAKATDADRRQSSASATTPSAEWVIVGETENFSGSSSSDSNGLNAMGVGTGMNKGRSDSVFVHADELDNFQSELVEYGDMKLDNDESGTYDGDDAHGDNGTAESYVDASAGDVQEVCRTDEDKIWKELQSTYKINHPYQHATTHEHRPGLASADLPNDDDEHDQMLNLYADADVMYRHQQQQLEQQNRMLVMSFEEEKTNIDLGEDDFVVKDHDRVGVRPAISNGWA